MASITDVVSTIQNGVTSFNNLTIHMKGSFNNILARINQLNATISAIASAYVISVGGFNGVISLGTGLIAGSVNDIKVADGVTLQTVYAELTTYTSGTTNMAGAADTIPQNTDGTQLLTVSITPKLSTSNLIIRSTLSVSNSAAVNMFVALFQDSTAGAISAVGVGIGAVNDMVPTAFTLQITSGTTSSTTFKLRIGNFTGGVTTWAVNGTSAARRLGGSQRVAITVEEIKA